MSSDPLLRMTKKDNNEGMDNKKKDVKGGGGELSETEKTISYIVDLITLSAGAAVFSCLLLNLAGRYVPLFTLTFVFV